MSRESLNLSQVSILLADGDQASLDLLAQMLRGFGAAKQRLVKSAADAKRIINAGKIDLIFCELSLADTDGVEFIRWIRRLKDNPIRFVPIMALTGYTDFSRVTQARDAGANIVVKKPISPQVLYDRLAWMSYATRPFVESETYAGPDRRFKRLGPPGGVGRRSSDLPAEVGAASEPNLSQDEIDALLKPTRVVSL